jgi:hypothetical protein
MALILLALLALVIYLVDCKIHPTKLHARCKGKGEIVADGGRVRRCWRCGGTGRLNRFLGGQRK